MTSSAKASYELSRIFERIAIDLDITEAQYNAIVTSYNAVAKWLSASDSQLAPYLPEIVPQGSFAIGTIVAPGNEKDDIDIDLVCRLSGKRPEWTQYDLKKIVGDRLRAHQVYRKMLDEESRRCWTLLYADSARYHMDVLPSLMEKDQLLILEKAIASYDINKARELGIRITDNQVANYYSSIESREWPSSNPFGYAIWFFEMARTEIIKAYSLREAVQPVPAYQKDKYPLQRVVQILKWHRDQMFNGDKEKPISIIITTLAARAYGKQMDVTDALTSVAQRLESMIEIKYDATHRRYIKWISNPVNPEENFADKWPDNPELERKFYRWVQQLQQDLDVINSKVGSGIHKIREAMEGPFNARIVDGALNHLGESTRIDRENGNIKMAAGSGLLGLAGRTTVTNHNNFGANE